jgi:hypothetical protein
MDILRETLICLYPTRDGAGERSVLLERAQAGQSSVAIGYGLQEWARAEVLPMHDDRSLHTQPTRPLPRRREASKSVGSPAKIQFCATG